MTINMNGLELATKIKQELKRKIENKKIGLVAILVGDNPASKMYVTMKQKACEEIGIKSKVVQLAETTESEVIEIIKKYNHDKDSHGILVQLPLPQGMDEIKILNTISPKKDVDGLTAVSLGYILQGKPQFIPATVKGILRLIEEYTIEVEGKEVVILGASIEVSRPLAEMFISKKATVTLCRRSTKNIQEHTSKADILISATGTPQLITKEYIKKGAVVIDVGINKNKEGKLCGDVHPDVKEKADYITPVPGGIGPMTIAMLLENTVLAAKNQEFE